MRFLHISAFCAAATAQNAEHGARVALCYRKGTSAGLCFGSIAAAAGVSRARRHRGEVTAKI